MTDKKTKNILIRASEREMEYWQIAATAQGYSSFASFARDALSAKASNTQAVLEQRRAALEAQIAAMAEVS
jgi:hypothetical protein